MGRAEREVYNELKQKYHHEEKKLQRVGNNPHKRSDVLSSLQEQCEILSDFCGTQAVDDEDEDKRLWWLRQSNYWNEKNERLDRELDEVMEDITEPPPPDR
ncbi:hypothetical protein CNMCM5623_004362 [Aspergillus felis]|uniref:Uncharacterized protein n=1 Tax=Aspergillus felis TaxID=1287682 RepID=A0A8H6R114_9EURO|nr:hypothetical protein CNMCM5623_004362 [Aspergillus felis]KAF7183240.1 hypothetical protein CNMCM7691_003153 [Aspergillus felis]